MEETASEMQETQQGVSLPEEGNSSAPEKTFEELIKGPYKEAYEKRIQKILDRRLRAGKETEAKYEELLGQVARKFGIDAKDPEAVKTALGEEKEKNAPVYAAENLYSSWLAQAEEAKAVFPGLELAKEAENPDFRARLSQGMTVEDAYFLTHREEILLSAMASAARDASEKISAALASGGLHPRENGAGAQAAATTRIDPAHMTKAQRQAYIRRVQKGETIRL